uniref:NADH dehydrogenase subunit 4L n=1 Tax=Xiphozele sp. QL-2014 TaxID=1491726 RepID=A0A0U1WEP3_9HYME|nr:NADH dehydrogenase subunit 4L [Xiphozele sp. QL-2014]
MFQFNFMLSIYLVIMSCLMYSYFYKHLLLNLISLEFIMLNIMLFMYLSMIMMMINLMMISYFLVLIVCESIMSLTLLIYLVRFSGNDYFYSLNLIKW